MNTAPHPFTAGARAAGSALLLAGLLAGLPWTLVRYGRWALPDHPPTLGQVWAQLQAPAALPLLLELLVLAGWITWAVLLAHTLAETWWWARRLPALLRSSTPLTGLTRRGVAAVLVAAIAIGIITALRASTPAAALTTRADHPSTGRAAAAVTAPLTPNPSAPQRTAARPVCTVRHGDTLWDLARRHLGDPLRWPEIYHLNHGRPQPDGGHLSDPDRIYPGWQLLLPSHQATAPTPLPAPGPSPRTHPAPAPTGTTTPPTPQPTSSPHAGGHPSHPTPAPASATTGTRGGIELPGSSGFIDIGTVLALSAAATHLLRQRRRRPYRPTAPRPLTAPQPAGPEGTRLVTAMRRIAREHLDEHGHPSPVDGPAIAVRDGTTATLTDLLHATTDRCIALVGEGAEAAVRALLVNALANSGSSALQVLAAQEDLAALTGDTTTVANAGLTITASLDEALDLLEGKAIEKPSSEPHDTQRDQILLTGQLLTNRQQHRMHRLPDLNPSATVVRYGPGATATVTYEVAPNGAARRLDPPGPGERLRFHHLPVHTAHTLLQLLHARRDADDENPEAQESAEEDPFLSTDGEDGETTQPAPAVFETPAPCPDTHAPAEPPKPAPTRVAEEEENTSPGDSALPLPQPSRNPVVSAVPTAPVRLTLLGPSSMSVRGRTVARGMTGNVGELLAYLAVHDHGATKDAITTALWPRLTDPKRAGATFNNTKTYARDILRDELGTTHPPAAFLSTGTGWKLNQQLISTDLADLRTALTQAHDAPDQATRLAACRRAASLHTGPLLDGNSTEWIEIHREDLRQRLLDCLDTLTNQPALPDEETLLHLAHAIRLDPYNEHLHLRHARLLAKLGRLDAVRRAEDNLRHHLADIDATPSPPVLQAFRRLLDPSTPAAATR
ncbi:BTAD domain-containing putative transcriptional regulator [Streptacidiphilus monticola]|uniref:BTAD domain-containing putative transcriptional regulator n=1 Tax=Streptacidiphilus monticola TaxID=2161674 RepID=A0ABW1G911_9ACTN